MNTIDLIKKHEGLRFKPYQCSEGHWTVGYGTNLETREITLGEAENWLKEEILKVDALLRHNFPWLWCQTRNRKDALINMTYQMGFQGVCKFKKMITAFEKGDYEEAAKQALDSKYAKQTPSRANEIAEMIRNG